MKVVGWTCDVCGRNGRVNRLDREDVASTRVRIVNDHKKASPSCDNRRFNITVGLPKGKSVGAIHARMVLAGGIIPK